MAVPKELPRLFDLEDYICFLKDKIIQGFIAKQVKKCPLLKGRVKQDNCNFNNIWGTTCQNNCIEQRKGKSIFTLSKDLFAYDYLIGKHYNCIFEKNKDKLNIYIAIRTGIFYN